MTIIDRKKQGLALSSKQIVLLIRAITDCSASDQQIATFTQAVCQHGMTSTETLALTVAMSQSGENLKWKLNGPVVDKHSTGGVGDFMSLVLAPTLAACGAYVPMITGRSLGHTGGTVDKLESIPGYNSSPSLSQFQQCVKEVGMAIVAQSSNIVPADKRMYAIRDATSTISSVPLIVSSILSKKVAEGLDALVIDLKWGNGAFARHYDVALELKSGIVEVAQAIDLKVECLLSDMSMPISCNVGNSLEIIEVIEFLSGQKRHPQALMLLENLASSLLIKSGLAVDKQQALGMIDTALSSGRAAEQFAKMIHYLGGPSDLVSRPNAYLKDAKVIKPVFAKRSGRISGYNMKHLGEMCRQLSISKNKPTTISRHRTGVSLLLPVGTQVDICVPLCHLHAESHEDWDTQARFLQQHCITVDSGEFTQTHHPIGQSA
ncbi:thymidine phosphorylase [Aliiglaciecola litoralis]|uniref:thymidine phosphorylase n=1 Tax=Aliiglaciecola litoralis TaxID=582857 RepID=UPI0031D8BC3A